MSGETNKYPDVMLELTAEEVLEFLPERFCEQIIWFQDNGYESLAKSLMSQARYSQIKAVHGYSNRLKMIFDIENLSVFSHMQTSYLAGKDLTFAEAQVEAGLIKGIPAWQSRNTKNSKPPVLPSSLQEIDDNYLDGRGYKRIGQEIFKIVKHQGVLLEKDLEQTLESLGTLVFYLDNLIDEEKMPLEDLLEIIDNPYLFTALEEFLVQIQKTGDPDEFLAVAKKIILETRAQRSGGPYVASRSREGTYSGELFFTTLLNRIPPEKQQKMRSLLGSLGELGTLGDTLIDLKEDGRLSVKNCVGSLSGIIVSAVKVILSAEKKRPVIKDFARFTGEGAMIILRGKS